MTEIQGVAEAPAGSVAAEPDAPATFLNVVVAGLFAVGALVWTGYFAFEYTIFNSGRWIHVAEGLLGLYYAATIAYGAARIRPRPRRHGLLQILLGFVAAQGALFIVAWGMAWLEDPKYWLAMMFVGTFLAGPIVAIASVVLGRRSFFLAIGELAGPAGFFLLSWLE